jgi:hypothetical protein
MPFLSDSQVLARITMLDLILLRTDPHRQLGDWRNVIDIDASLKDGSTTRVLQCGK